MNRYSILVTEVAQLTKRCFIRAKTEEEARAKAEKGQFDRELVSDSESLTRVAGQLLYMEENVPPLCSVCLRNPSSLPCGCCSGHCHGLGGEDCSGKPSEES